MRQKLYGLRIRLLDALIPWKIGELAAKARETSRTFHLVSTND